MTKGRRLEHGLTNKLYGTEIAEIMESFSDGGFQIQVWKDLAVARYKLYDATGMWLQSRPYVTPNTYSEIEDVGRGYLEETLVPAYFRRLRDDPYGPVPTLRLKHANFVTRNFAALPPEEQAEATAEFLRSALRTDDWFYSLREGRVFAAENETGGYTLMLAEDY